MEISLVDYRLLEHPPSLVAAGAVWMAREVLERGEWTPTLTHYSSYSETELLSTAEIMLDYILRPTAHANFHKKYAGKKFMKASNYVIEWARGAFPEAAEQARAEPDLDLSILLVDLFERQGLVRPAVDGHDGISRASTLERDGALVESGDFESEGEASEGDDADDDEQEEKEEEQYEEEEEEEVKPKRGGGRR